MLCVPCPGPLGPCSPVCPLGGSCRVCGVVSHLAPVQWCVGSVFCVPCAVSWATWLLFTGVPARCFVLRVRCPGQLGSCSPVCPLFVLHRVCGVLGHLAPVHRCVGSELCVLCAVSWAIWPLFTCVPARWVVSCVRCREPLGFCSVVCWLSVLCCVCGVLGHLAPVHLCARSDGCVACAVSWVTWLLFTGVLARCFVLRVRCPGPLGSCSPGCSFCALCSVRGVLGHLALVPRCVGLVLCVVCVVSWALGSCSPVCLLGVSWRVVVSGVRCPGPLGSCSPVCPHGVSCHVCRVLGHLAPLHQCASPLRCVLCAVSWASWLLFTGVLARCVALRVRGVLGHLASVLRCARSVFRVVCAVSWATWLLLTGVPARWVVLHARCPVPISLCSPVSSLHALCCVCGVLGHLAPVHQCACSVLCAAFAVSWATWLLFIGLPARCVVLRVQCPGPLGSCSPVCSLNDLCCVSGVLGNLARAHRLLARRSVLRTRCPRSLGGCSPVCSLGVLCCVLRLWCCVCGASLPDACSSIWTAVFRSRQGLGTLRARTRPSGRRLFHSRQGHGTLRACTRPSECRLFRCWQGLGSLPGAHTSVWTAAGVALHLFSCCESLGVVRALRVCSTQRRLLLRTCLCTLVVAGGVPFWRA